MVKKMNKQIDRIHTHSVHRNPVSSFQALCHIPNRSTVILPLNVKLDSLLFLAYRGTKMKYQKYCDRVANNNANIH